MAKFISKHGNLIVQQSAKTILKFVKQGGIGVYETEDKKTIEFLRNHKDFNKQTKGGFAEYKSGLIDYGTKEVVKGVRAGATATEIGLKEKVQRYEELKEKIVKVNGDFRKDASDEQIAEYKALEQEIK